MTRQQERLTSIPHNWNKTYTKHHPYQSLSRKKENVFSTLTVTLRAVDRSTFQFLTLWAKDHSTEASNFPLLNILKIQK